ncbi:MAG TPA: hypothetical protein VGD95_00130 [Micavibrio sp.]
MGISDTLKKKNNSTNYKESWAHHECPPLTHIEYNIYSYSNDDNPRACWQKCGSAPHPQSAMIHAENLFNTGQFKKVEVKQRYYDARAGRNIDETWRVFEQDSQRSSSSWLCGAGFITAAVLFVTSMAMAQFW